MQRTHMCTQTLLTFSNHKGITGASGQGRRSAVIKTVFTLCTYRELQKIKGYKLLIELCETHS